MARIRDLNAYRKEKKRKEIFNKLIFTAVIFIVVFSVWTFRETIFEPLRGIANRRGGGDEGFPVVLSGSAGYSMNRVDTNFLLLSDTYLYTYNYRGGRVITHRHNYARPMQRANDRRTLIYNFNGHEFSLFTRNSLIYEEKLEDRIVLAELGDNDMVAVVTTSAAFSNILLIYDGNGNWRYRQRFIDEEVMAVEFASQSNEIFVATSTVRNGDIVSKLYRFRTDTEDDLIWQQYLPQGIWALQINENGNYISVLSDTMIMTYSGDGEFIGSYGFDSGRLVRDIYGDEFNLVILSDYVTGRTLYVTLDPQSHLIKSEIMPFEVKQVEIFGEIVYTLTGAGLIQHDRELNQLGIIELEDEFRDFVIVNQHAMLLGYGTVERVELN